MNDQKIFDIAITAGGYFTQLLSRLGFNSNETAQITDSMKNAGMFDGSKIRGVGLDETGTAIVYPDTGVQNDNQQYVVRMEGAAYDAFRDSAAQAMAAAGTSLTDKDESIRNLIGGAITPDGGPVREDPPYPPSDPGFNNGGPVREDPPYPPSDLADKPHGNHLYPQNNLQPPAVDETEVLRMQQEKLASINGGPVREDPPYPPSVETMGYDQQGTANPGVDLNTLPYNDVSGFSGNNPTENSGFNLPG